MTKRAAIMIAGVLVASLVAGAFALSTGRGIVGASAASPKTITKTETNVVTVHKRRPAKPTTVTIVRNAPSGSSFSGGDDSGFESEGAGGDD